MFDTNNLNDNFFLELNQYEILDIKDLSLEEKIKCFKFFLTSDVITNNSVIYNIYLIIDGIRNISDESFGTDKRIFFKDLEDYVDVKLELDDVLKTFNTRLVQYYLGIIEGLDVKLAELKEHIPNTHFNLFRIVNPELISKLMLRYLKNIDINKVKPAFMAKELYAGINISNNKPMAFYHLMGAMLRDVKSS